MNTDARNLELPCSWVPAFAGTTRFSLSCGSFSAAHSNG